MLVRLDGEAGEPVVLHQDEEVEVAAVVAEAGRHGSGGDRERRTAHTLVRLPQHRVPGDPALVQKGGQAVFQDCRIGQDSRIGL